MLIYLLGLRFWLLYLWFAFMAGIAFSEYDFKAISKVMVLLLMAMAPLAVMQHFLPPTSFWNKQLKEGGLIFTVSRDIVRITGTFSFTMGYTVFLAMASPFVFLSLDASTQLWQAKWMPIVAIVALLVATIVSGSRGAIIFFGLLFLIYALASMRFAKGRKKGKSLLMILVVLAMLAASLSIFSRAVEATRERFEGAYQSESPIGRLIYSSAPQGEIPFLGEGIGMGSNFAGFLETGQRAMNAESENARIILELGWLGIGLILIKIFIVLRSGRKSLRIAKRTGSVSTLLIWVAIAMDLFFWPIVGQLTVNALGFLLFGLGIAALRLDQIRLRTCRS